MAKREKRANRLFYLGLFYLTIPFSGFILLLLIVMDVTYVISASAGLSLVILIQILGLLSKSLSCLRVYLAGSSFRMLKLLQGVLKLPEFAPEKMIITMNNDYIINGDIRKFKPSETLILLPHCLQDHRCEIRLTFNPYACEKCGRCPMGDLVDIAERYGVELAIASGGTSARSCIERREPKLIIAVACPIDLSSGILDVQPITTVGILNEWHHGECFDTWVDTAKVEDACRTLLFL